MPLQRVDRVLGFEHGIPVWLAAGAGLVGLCLLVAGWRLHRPAVVLFGGLLGALAGSLVAARVGIARGWGLGVGFSLAALLAWPLLRAVVFLLCGLATGVAIGQLLVVLAGGGFWWGFVPGFLLGGLASIRFMKQLVMLATSYVGARLVLWSALLVLGATVVPAAASFPARHPVATMLIGLLLWLIGLALQLRLDTGRRAPAREYDV